ncbi:XRE family transcriptional regulator [Mesorhizobium sp. M2D.F.Ca.ET.223.01.1.1]|uniref:helix-turn-helix domain-containing protein n=1 Tax=Mesorhizobium sp. M2D.F.Ca.ET.223.01.1.1 TaxID=2563940 RepID=UPI001092252B|nr:helix-turn-helix transcriptional regulator [Mesorhizobium sp. M2D.F.Ca.ET.223.01.1.1]TGP86395.1 XRE family transcriptional regulator [bacterium M00.F.Ca.ET.221.01.1.1]TGR88737.1 XRE family transcriptional regulator [Mesorhizobium sp. M2D.F.Ca.ET.223.01.1.1]
MRIDPTKLRTQRKLRDWTQQDLAQRAGLSLRQIAALEQDRVDSEGHPVRQSTVVKLTGALTVDPSALIQEGEGWTISRRQALHIPMPSHVQLRYDLIQERYRVSMLDLVEAAPMLFMLAARSSLSWRRDKLEEARSHLAGLRASMGYVLTDAQTTMLASIEEGIATEAKAIENGTLFTPSEFSAQLFESNRFLDWVDATASEPDDIELIALRKVSSAPEGLHLPHNVCRKTLYDIAGHPGEPGASRAIYALASGEVRLHDIPEDLRGAEKRKERIAWLGEQVDGPEDEEWCADTYPGLHPNTARYSTRYERAEEPSNEQHDPSAPRVLP